MKTPFKNTYYFFRKALWKEYIKKIKYFENCGFTEDKELQEIAEIADYQLFPARNMLFEYGDEGKYFYIMLDGLVDLIIPDEKKDEEIKKKEIG